MRSSRVNSTSNCVHASHCVLRCPLSFSLCICVYEQVEEIVPVGSLDPESIHLPGVYVHRLIQGTGYEKRIERLKLDQGEETKNAKEHQQQQSQQDDDRSRERIVKRAAQEIKASLASLSIYLSSFPIALSFVMSCLSIFHRLFLRTSCNSLTF